MQCVLRRIYVNSIREHYEDQVSMYEHVNSFLENFYKHSRKKFPNPLRAGHCSSCGLNNNEQNNYARVKLVRKFLAVPVI